MRPFVVLGYMPVCLAAERLLTAGIIAGLMAYVLGRSRRGAFICGVLGVLFADIIVAIVNSARGISQTLVLGGAGVFDAAVISGLIGVILAELIGGGAFERHINRVRRSMRRKLEKQGGVME